MKKILFSIFVLLLLSNCATLVSGTTTSINLQSSNPDYEEPIKVQVSNRNTIQTITLPGTTTVKRDSDSLDIVVKDKCFRETQSKVNSRVNYWTLGNVITGGLTGTTTDALSGALWTYDDSYIVPVQSNGICKTQSEK